ncbi:MAG TPA: flagellar hook-basal body complex protein [Syntrophorhabdales bacterium]|nr:flagellar hook-basal body complex protein [Syntrophorhabdales bacterium]
MLSSLYSGISGLTAESQAMGVIGNNVANSNTVGFKASRATFSDMLYQSIFGTAGTSQVGRGVALESVDTDFQQGSFESTNNPTDLAIGGQGFFIVRPTNSNDLDYTRAGQFQFNKDGYMVDPTNNILQGRVMDTVTNSPMGVAKDIIIPQGPSEPKATGTIGIAANLQSDAPWKGTVGSVTGTSGLSQVAASNGQYPMPGDYTAVVTNLLASQIGHTGTNAASNGTEFTGAVIINDYEIMLPTSNGPTTAASLATYLDSMLAMPSAGYASQVWASYTVDASGYQHLSLSATADGVDISFDDSALATGSTGWTADDKASTDLYGSQMSLTSVTTGPDGSQFMKTYAGKVSAQVGTLTNWGNSGNESGLDLTFAHQANFVVTPGTSNFTIGGFEPNQVSDTLNPSTTSNYSTSVTVYDSLGQSHVVTVYFRKAWEQVANSVQTNVWEYYAEVSGADSADGQPHVAKWGYLDFNSNGVLMSGGDPQSISFDFSNGAAPNQQISLILGPQSGGGSTTQYPMASTTNFQTQDGYAPGQLTSISVSTDGIISGHYSNGQVLGLYQITLASFNNPWGLNRIGGNLYSETYESGPAFTNAPGVGILGNINPDSLEQSNVDLATEFVNMITTERGYQANSKVITTTDAMLQTLMDLKASP